MIRVEGARVRLGDFMLSADLDVPKGAICALIGPSGGGKSTLLNLIAGFLEPEAGRIEIAGRDMAGLAPSERPATMLFQEHNLFPHLDIERNLGLGLRPDLRLDAADRRRIAAALAEFGLEGFGPRRPESLSGGQRQRAALARALLRERPALLLDEPFAALGPAQRREMLALTTDAARERELSVLMITHAPEDARRAAELTAFCADGRVDGARPTEDLLANPPPALRAYLGLED